MDLGEEFGRYQMCKRDGRSAAGIGPLQSPDQPVAWTTYLASDAVDDTAEKITENGGTVLAGPSTSLTPDGCVWPWTPKAPPSGCGRPPKASAPGRMAVITDPQGATFSIMGVMPTG